MKDVNAKTIAIIFVIVLLIIVSIFVYLEMSKKPVEEEEKLFEPAIPITQVITKTYAELEREGLLDHIDIVDDRISPLAPQLLFFEVKRIRHRGFFDTIMQRGLAWRQNPQYYYTLTIDGFTHNSKDIYSPTGYEEIFFEVWDTMFQETRRVQSAIDEEQETSEIVFTIFQEKPSGLLGLRTDDKEMDQIHLTYCYRTGRWSGDNYFGHPNGYGNFLGENFEIWFDISQSSYTLDGIPYWTKVNVLRLDPLIDYSDKDVDGDGILIPLEWKWGYDPFTRDDHANLDPDIDGLNNLEEYKMSTYFANPFKPDIYIEADGMKKSGFFGRDHVLYDESILIITEEYARRGVNVYIDNGWPGTPSNAGGELLDHVISVDQDSGMQLRYYRHHFSDERKGIFRYLVICDGGGHAYPSQLNRVDTIIVGTKISLWRFFVNYGMFTHRTRILSLASQVMHELGHTSGLLPWSFQGIDNYTLFEGNYFVNFLKNVRYGLLNPIASSSAVDVWVNYESSMNYLYASDFKIVGYSDGHNGPPYDQNDWEHMYLPFFTIEGNAAEDPTMYFDENFEEISGWEIAQNFINAAIDLDIPPISSKGYTFDQNLTLEYADELKELVFVLTPHYDLRVYVNENSTDKSQRNIRVYAKPDLGPTYYSEWSLIAEGYYYESELIMTHGLWTGPNGI